MSATHEHAIVLGGSMAGMVAARVLSEHFARVTVVERDVLGDDAAPRKGQPQARHVHGFYSTGVATLCRLFPGLGDELRAAGAITCDLGAGLSWWHWGGYRLRAPIGRDALFLGRPALDRVLRARLRAIGNVELLDGHDALGVIADDACERVTGVRVRARGGLERALPASLVVDATGRGSRAIAWLGGLGVEPPPVTEIACDVGYATRVYRRRAGDLGGATAHLTSPAAPAETRASVIFPIEPDGNGVDRWLVTLCGWVGDHPPLDDAGFAAFARSLPTPETHALIASAEPLGDAVPHRFPCDQRRHWERLRRVPDGFVVVGDAMASFNPAYGQGMTVAVLCGVALGDAVARGPAGLPRRFYQRAAAIVDRAWQLAAGEDLRYPQIAGARPFGTAALHRFVARVHRASQRDPAVLRALFEVMELARPAPSLMRPSILWRVIARGGDQCDSRYAISAARSPSSSSQP